MENQLIFILKSIHFCAKIGWEAAIFILVFLHLLTNRLLCIYWPIGSYEFIDQSARTHDLKKILWDFTDGNIWLVKNLKDQDPK